MTTPLPSAHEPLPADFLRKYGAQKGMRYRQKGNAEDAWDLWPDWGDKFPAETCYNLYDFCAPAGTIAAYAIPAQPGQGKGKEYRVTCPHCLGQQKANGAVCLECNGIGYWMNPYPLSTQPEGGEGECMVPITGYPGISLGKCEVDLATGEVTPSPPSTAGEGHRRPRHQAAHSGPYRRTHCPPCRQGGGVRVRPQPMPVQPKPRQRSASGAHEAA